MSDFEWTFLYEKSERRLLLVLGKNPGRGVIEGGRQFPYGKVVHVNYQDEDSMNLLVHTKTSKGDRVLVLSETKLIVKKCMPLELARILGETMSIIMALKPFIAGEAVFEESEEAFSQDADVRTEVRHNPPPILRRKRTGGTKQRVQKKPIKKP